MSQPAPPTHIGETPRTSLIGPPVAKGGGAATKKVKKVVYITYSPVS